MTELSPAARALLAAARAGLAPDAATVTRMRRGVEASVAATAAGSVVAWKLGIVGLIAAFAVGAALHTEHAGRHRAGEVPRLELSSAHRDPWATEGQTAVASDRAPPMPMPMRMPMPAIRAAAARPPVAVAAITRADLAREVELLDRAMAALRRADPARALSTIRLHAVETADAGQLAEEAAAIEIEALCALRDPSVAARLARFDARFPRSAQRSRLTCR